MIWQIAARNNDPDAIRRSIEWGAVDAKEAWRKLWRIARQTAKMAAPAGRDLMNETWPLAPRQHQAAAHAAALNASRDLLRSGDVLARVPDLLTYRARMRRCDYPLTAHGARFYSVRPALA